MARNTHTKAVAKATVKQRRLTVIKQRRAGMTIPEIAKRNHVSQSTVEKDLHEILSEIDEKTSKEASLMRALWYDRLERAVSAIWNKVLLGDTDAIKTLLKIGDSEAKLFGLNKEHEKIDIVFITQIIKLVQLRGGDPMSIFKAIYEELQDTPILIEANHD